MAMQVPFPVRFEDVFPDGPFALDVSAVEDLDKPQGTDRQTRDKTTGERVWSVRVLDGDPDSRKGHAELAVKIAAGVQPIPPETLRGLPFRQVEFDGMTVTPYVHERGERRKVAYGLHAKAMRPPGVVSASPATGPYQTPPR